MTTFLPRIPELSRSTPQSTGPTRTTELRSVLLELVAARPSCGPRASAQVWTVVHPASRLPVQRYMSIFLPSILELTLLQTHPTDHGIGQGQQSSATCYWSSTRQGLGDCVASKHQVRFSRFPRCLLSCSCSLKRDGKSRNMYAKISDKFLYKISEE